MNSCKGKAVCSGCGEEGHNLDDCQNDPKCVNCHGDHVAISRDCPKWKIEKDIVTLKYTEKMSFADARKCLQPSFDPSKDSYATVTQTPPQSSRPLPPWARKIRLPIDFKTDIEYLKYILNYCLTRLDTLDEITSENPVPRDAPSSDETPPPPQTPEQKNETTILKLSSAQGGRNRATIKRLPLSKPPGTIKTATKLKTKSKEKNTPSCWKIMVYWLNNSVIIGQIDRQLII